MLSAERQGAFAACSPTAGADVAGVYGDGEGGKVAHSGLASVRHSKQDLEIDAESSGDGGNLPRFGYENVVRTIEDEEDPDNLAGAGGEVDQSFQTMRADDDDDSVESYDEEQAAFGFYGATKPEYDQMESLMQADTFYGDVLDDHHIDKIGEYRPSKDEDGLGCLAASGGLRASNMARAEVQADEDQFEFAANLN